MLIKTLKVQDIQRICDYCHEIDNIFPVPMSSRVNIEAHIQKVLQYGTVIVAEEKGEIVGICLGYANDNILKRAYLGTLGVSVGYRSLGTGSKLVDEMIEFSRKNNMSYIGVHTHQDNVRALKFYQKKGFVVTEDLEKPYEESVYLTQKL